MKGIPGVAADAVSYHLTQAISPCSVSIIDCRHLAIFPTSVLSTFYSTDHYSYCISLSAIEPGGYPGREQGSWSFSDRLVAHDRHGSYRAQSDIKRFQNLIRVLFGQDK